jgi:hypothetical protein
MASTWTEPSWAISQNLSVMPVTPRAENRADKAATSESSATTPAVYSSRPSP